MSPIFFPKCSVSRLSEAMLSQRIQNLRCILIETANFEESVHFICCGNFQIGCGTCHIDDYISNYWKQMNEENGLETYQDSLPIPAGENDLLCAIVEIFTIFFEFFNGHLSLTAESGNRINNDYEYIDFFLQRYCFGYWLNQTLVWTGHLPSETKIPSI